MALTGLALFLFVVGHLIGNLQVFLGPDSLNSYAAFLKANPKFLWAARIGLLVVFLVHMYLAWALSRENKKARPVQYYDKDAVTASLSSRTMGITGSVILVFVIFHLMHYTLFLINPEYKSLQDAHNRHDVYTMLIFGFSHWQISLGYLLAVGLLSFHLSHGLQSMFQSLGFKDRNYEAKIKLFSKVAAILLFLGYASIPIAVMVGVIKPMPVEKNVVTRKAYDTRF